MSIGSRIKEKREQLGLTQPQLAELLGVSKGTVGNYESNISSPNEQTLFKLFEILKCDANFLYQDNLAPAEMELQPKEKDILYVYRNLDEFGKKAIDALANIEYERVKTDTKNIRLNTQTDDNMISIPLVARGKVKGVQHIQVNEKEFEEDMENLVESKNKDL